VELVWKDEAGHKIFMSITSPPWNFLVIYTIVKWMHVVQFITTGRSHCLISVLNIYHWTEETLSTAWWNLRAVCWKDKWKVYVLSNTNIPPAEGNFKEDEKALIHLISKDYLTHTDYIDLSDRMVNSHSIGKKTSIWMKKPQHWQENLDMDENTPLLSVRPNHSEFIHSAQVLWGKYDQSELQGAAMKRIAKSMMCQGVGLAVWRLKWADLK
jgi:hypothetical protein